MLEHMRSLDLQARYYRKISGISYEQIQDISDAVQGIFDYLLAAGEIDHSAPD
jgi:hypothetical protein